jgi:hypothetical protein
MLRVRRSAIRISPLAPTAALEDATPMRIAVLVQSAANSAVAILSVLESVDNSVFLAPSHALGSVSIADVVTCRVGHPATDCLVIYVATVASNVAISARQFAERFVHPRTFVSNVALQS